MSCVVPGCQTNLTPSFKKGREKRSVFNFPLENEKLLKSWINKVPINFKNFSLNKKSKICEKHFENRYKVKGEQGQDVSLTKNAIPTIFEETTLELNNLEEKLISGNCRFCLAILHDIRIEIDEEIEKKFENLTQTKLKRSNVKFSQHICFTCHRGLQFSVWFKEILVKKQQSLFKTLTEDHEDYLSQNLQEEIDRQFEGVLVKKEKDFIVSVDNDSVLNAHGGIKKEPFDESLEENEFQMQFEDENVDSESDINVTKYLEAQAQYPSDEDDSDKPLKKSKSQKKPKKQAKWRSESVLCQDCGKIMRHASLQLHIDRKHRGLKGDFVCDLCGYRTHTKNILKYHLTVHSKVRNYKCKECDRWFPTPGSVISHHKNIHRKDEPPKYSCQYCGKAFRIRHKLNDHVRAVHLKERRYACAVPGCGQTFTVRTTYYHHKNEHDGITFDCPQCPSKFYLKKKLKEHMNRHSRPFRCEICGDAFHARPLLDHHQKSVHEGIREFKCQICPAEYSRKIYLDRHVMSYHLNLKLSCEIQGCKSLFARKETYKRHVQVHHKDLGEERIAAILLKIRNLKMNSENLVAVKGCEKPVC